MNNFQQNLLIGLALALCGLCAFQWHEQTVQRNEIATLNGIVYQRNVAFRDATNSMAALDRRVGELDARLAVTSAKAATNDDLVIAQRAELTQLRVANQSLTNEVWGYQAAVAKLNDRLAEAYAGIQKQNEAITNLVAQRDEMVGKYNREVEDRNEIVAKYNELAKRVAKGQEGAR